MSDFYLSLPPIGGGSDSLSWKDPVTTVGDLPSVGNTVGDARVVTDNNAVFVWGDDDAWHAPASGAVWGAITGTLADQTDLQAALDAKLALAGGTMAGDLKMGAYSIKLDTLNLCYITSPTLGVIRFGNTASNRAFTVGSQSVSSGDLTNDLNGYFTLGDSGHRWKSVYSYAYTCSESANGIVGADPTMGLATLVGGTATITNTGVSANSRIYLTIQDPNGGTVGTVYISARVNGTSFTITSTSALDTSKVAWLLVEAV